MAWTYLVVAGLFEVAFTTFLKLSQGFTRLLPSLGFLLFSILSFWFLTKAIQSIPLGTAYAVWTGLGAVGTAIVGILFFGDPAGATRLLLLFLIIASVVGLKLIAP